LRPAATCRGSTRRRNFSPTWRTGDLFGAIDGAIYAGTSDIQKKIIAAETRILE